jgi:hypothetical protein
MTIGGKISGVSELDRGNVSGKGFPHQAGSEGRLEKVREEGNDIDPH